MAVSSCQSLGVVTKRTNVKCPLVPYCLAPRVVVHTPDDIREVIEAGQLENIEFDSYFEDVHPDESENEDDEDDDEDDHGAPDGEEDESESDEEEDVPLAKKKKVRVKEHRSAGKGKGGGEYQFSGTDTV